MSVANLKAAATGKVTPQEARNPFDQLKRQLENGKAEFLPLFGGSQQNVDRFIRVVLNAVLATPDLLEVDRRSLMAASMKAAQDGLMPDGREAVLNIYNTKRKGKNGQPDEWVKMAQYLPMVAGLVKKLYESGDITSIDAAAVYKNDRFLFRRGDEPKLEHEPTMEDDAGSIVAAYAVIRMKNGDIKREVMPRRDIEAVRAASKSKDNGPWVTWYDQQAIKSVIKRIYKQLPKADAFEKIADSDNQALGFAATPESVGDIVSRQAIENNPGETLQHNIVGEAREVVMADRQDQHEASDSKSTAPAVVYADVIAGMLKAKTVEAIDEAALLIPAVADAGQRTELNQKYDALRAELQAT